MKFIVVLVLLAICSLPLETHAQAQGPTLECKVGPLNKTFGGTAWLVYACADDKSVVVVSAPGNPAAPFYFSVSYKDGDLQLYGEGDGDKAASDAAGKEIEGLSAKDVAALIVGAKAQQHASLPKSVPN